MPPPPRVYHQCVKARALSEILGISPKARVPVLIEGLNVLVEHVETLRGTVAHLLERSDPRGAAILDVVAVEEAGKVLVLLDFVRAGTKRQARLKRTLQHFYDHVARGIYAEVATMRPAGYREVREIVEYLRPAFYRDGPNGYEWVFRNRIEAQREEKIYVDFVHDDDGTRWVTPEEGDRFPLWNPSRVMDLVTALHRSGLFTAVGLKATEAAWRDVAMVDTFPWQEVRRRNIEVLQGVGEAGLQHPQFSERDLARAVEQWSFPLFDLDLSKRKVGQVELDEQLMRGRDQFYRDTYGT